MKEAVVQKKLFNISNPWAHQKNTVIFLAILSLIILVALVSLTLGEYSIPLSQINDLLIAKISAADHIIKWRSLYVNCR